MPSLSTDGRSTSQPVNGSVSSALAGYGGAVVDGGIVVVEVPPALTMRERHRPRCSSKSDPADVLAIVRITAREKELPPVVAGGPAEDPSCWWTTEISWWANALEWLTAHADLTIAHLGYQTAAETWGAKPRCR